MIQYANQYTAPQIRQMWKTVFGDSDSYIDIYFREKYRNERTLVYLEGEKAVASLQMLPYNFTFCDVEIPVAYISGVSTLPEAQKKGYMHQLLLKSFEEMAKNNISLAILVPQEAWLLEFYDKYGYAQTFDAGVEEVFSLKTLLDKHLQDEESAYNEFDSQFRSQDMTVQKTFEDFQTIVEEGRLFNFPSKKNLIGMARMIDAEKLLSIFAKKYPQKHFSVILDDEIIQNNNTAFVINSGLVTKNTKLIEPILHLNIRKFTQLLFGYHTSKKDIISRALFPEKTAQMNFMLE
ncbi:MAG: GNAT family N-acetyltransferase [Dysgonamonadaceae bacterium]|jgi:predicted acetyltransferase|nr:GNAT family N-acetyltransferase [Dysgonamonadaceae bacterium]